MGSPSDATRVLARRLLAVEAASESAGAHPHVAVRVFEKLRISLTRFAGADGFTSLLRRALTMARSDVPDLSVVNLSAGGSLEGFEELAAVNNERGTEAALAITAHLLELLVTFIGRPIALRLLRDAWPDASLDL